MGEVPYKDYRHIPDCLEGYVLKCMFINILELFKQNIYSATFMPMMIVPLAVR